MFNTFFKLKRLENELETVREEVRSLRRHLEDVEDTLTRRVQKLMQRAKRDPDGNGDGERPPETEAERINRAILERRRTRGIPHGTG
jgi:hypothetical protein